MLARDSSYHQGTVWPWLMGPFVIAYYDAHNRDAAARQRCLQWLSALKEYRRVLEIYHDLLRHGKIPNARN